MRVRSKAAMRRRSLVKVRCVRNRQADLFIPERKIQDRFATIEAFGRVMEMGAFSIAARQPHIGQSSESYSVVSANVRMAKVGGRSASGGGAARRCPLLGNDKAKRLEDVKRYVRHV